ncbi:flagellar biosynthesis protein FlhF [Bacillus sp. V3B]|uniref:flagellar biosynthesis protein FlhF n=1 Tax=Bacillus sp. V3B TaxID=2804915 RepID=UPI0021091015|nr:flagellar biosynthesis protein FlhF [Bacillus sp. V3B]MCQ6274112.1 flagellar biosynthesis protein FlhF [Bacillus sp. V3B]
MKVKKYRASSMPEAMKLIRNELGNDAIILNSKVIQIGGFLGFFKKRNIEVIAALDVKPAKPTKPLIEEKQKHVDIPFSNMDSRIEKIVDKEDEVVTDQWKKELSELKSLLQNVKFEGHNDGIPLPTPIQQLKQLLTKQEINQEIIEKVVNMAVERWYLNGGNKSEEEVIQWAQEYLMKQISPLPFGGISFTKKYINVVGPTGVGKTTTLAKIAAECILKYKKRVAFITTDTYRIAAIEQLKTYANILNVPLEVCYNLNDFQQATIQFESYDMVFIDTAGRNFRNQKYVEDLKTIIDYNQDMETFLVLSLTSKQIDMEDILEQFSLISIDKIIFTKADETSTYGAMFNVIHAEQTAAAYITNGQNVPDDLVEATPENVVNRIIGVD